MVVKLCSETIRIMGIFERITGIHAYDCLVKEDCIYFLIDPEKIGLAIGKGARVVKKLSSVLGKQVKFIGYSKSPEDLLKNNIQGLKNIYSNNNTLTISVSNENKRAVIGRNGENIQGSGSDLIINTNRAANTLVYADATQGWLLKNV